MDDLKDPLDAVASCNGHSENESLFHLEVVQRPQSSFPSERLRKRIEKVVVLALAEAGTPWGKLLQLVCGQGEKSVADLEKHVEAASVFAENDERPDEDDFVAAEQRIVVHVFKLDRDGAQTEDMPEVGEGSESGVACNGIGVQAATHWILPSQDLHGLWESLVFDNDVKVSLLSYVEATLLLSGASVDPNLVSWNKVVLLHGPPGTGKTSLCKALAHKLSIRLSKCYDYGQLVEVNSHSLFSKWFSESGKLVQRMFDSIREIVDDPKAFVCVLLDEVESLAAVRNASGNEPSDAIRVVNALLTQIDALKRCPNVLLLTTSNVTGAIDLAFVDRADLKYFVGLPSVHAAYAMMVGSALELMSKNLLERIYLLSWDNLHSLEKQGGERQRSKRLQVSTTLLEVSRRCEGLSGRTIRKLPFLAVARLVQVTGGRNKKGVFSMQEYLKNLGAAVESQYKEKESLSHSRRCSCGQRRREGTVDEVVDQ